MREYDPPIGRVLPVSRQQVESESARRTRLERERFYCSRRWRTVSKLQLACEPLCCWCGRLAELADHIIPRLARPDLAFKDSNLRSCCRRCHARHGEKRGGGVGQSDKIAVIQGGHFA